uniref:Uncharacterized protein n=1 Tax=Rhizophora mucronata TaxID=61149 RepID=A0A2P2LPK0_RHIMU
MNKISRQHRDPQSCHCKPKDCFPES